VTPQRPFLTTECRNLVMLNYEIDPSILAGRIPAGCEIDFWRGLTFASSSALHGALLANKSRRHAARPVLDAARSAAVTTRCAGDA
jgi:uncharacterized protein YqjF (DUF2071 family)